MRPEAPSDPRPLPLRAIAHTDEGEGPTVVCVHGAPGSVRDFRWLAPALVDCGFRVVRIDLPGFGAAPPCERQTIVAHADAIVSGLAMLEIRDPILLGHSIGAIISTEICAQAPGLARGLCLVSSPGLVRHRAFPKGRFMVQRLLDSPRRARLLRPILVGAFRSAGFTGDYPYDTLINTMHLVGSVDFTRHSKNVHRLELPTGVVYAADDPLIETRISEGLANACPSGPRLVFEDGGHNPQKHHALEIAARLRRDWRSPSRTVSP